jgi:glycine cleavage system H protein
MSLEDGARPTTTPVAFQQSSRGEGMEPTDLRYHEEHEWIRMDGKQATMGISNFAQDALGDIVFIDMPKVGSTVAAGQQVGEVESTKTTSSIYTPVSGKIVKINTELKDHPEVVNADPYGKGWIAVIELSDPDQVNGLMTAEQYEAFLKK